MTQQRNKGVSEPHQLIQDYGRDGGVPTKPTNAQLMAIYNKAVFETAGPV